MNQPYLIKTKSLLIIFVIAFIMSTVLLFDSFSADSQMLSYEEYLSCEMRFEPDTVGYGYDGYVFFINSNDKNYLYKYNIETKDKELFYEDSITCLYYFRSHIYCATKDNTIIELDPNGEYHGVVFTGNKPISNLYCDQYALYFIMDSTIFRYFINEEKLDTILYNDCLISFIPITNQVIEWNCYSKDWLDYLRDTHDLENHCEIKTDTVFSYDLRTGKSTPIDDFTFNKELERTLEDVPATRITINGHAIPHSSYGGYTYFSYNSTGCTCHDTSCSISGPLCDCRRAYNTTGSGNAIQCHGFGCFIYRYIWNLSSTQAFPSSKYVGGITLSSNTSVAAAEAETYIESLNPGALIRFTKRSNTNKHTIILVACNQTSSSGATNCLIVYHGNAGTGVYASKCTVMYQYMTFDYIAQKYSSIDYAYN